MGKACFLIVLVCGFKFTASNAEIYVIDISGD